MAKAKAAPATVTLERREGAGTTAARAVRRAGKVPGVLYGHGTTTSIAVEPKGLNALVAAGARTHAVDVTLDGATVSVLLRGIEHDPISRNAISIDLQQLDAGEAIYATLPVVTSGTAPGVKDFGGVLEIVHETIEVKGPSDRIPENVVADVSSLALHGHVTAGELPLPDGVALITPRDTTIVSIVAIRGLETPAATEAAPADAPAAGA